MFDFTKKNCFKEIRNLVLSKNFLWVIIAFGSILYLRQYLYNRSLWIDEAMVSLDIIRLPVSNFLHQPLPGPVLGGHDNPQVAPFGFLVIEKLFISLFGAAEYVLRLYPFVCGLISLWLFSRMAKIYLNVECAALALFVFAITPSLIYYSSEVKPYYTDVFFVLFSYVVIAQFCLNELDWDKINITGLLGALIIWFSYPIIFILLGIIIPLLLISIIQRDWPKSLKLGIIFLYWFISFIINYIFLLHNLGHINDPGRFWQSEVISFQDSRSWLRFSLHILDNLVGIKHYTTKFTVLFFFLGGYSFFKEDKRSFFIFMAPLLFVFFACGLHIYSCVGRLVLFLIPIVLLMIIKGIQMISLKTGRWRIIVAILLTGVLFFSSFFSAYKGFIKPRIREDVRSVISYIKENIKQGDVLYIYYGAVPAFEYYVSLLDFHPDNYIEEVDSRNQPLKWEDDLKKLHGSKRVWLLFSHIWDDNIDGMNEKEHFFHYLSESGAKMLDQFSIGAGVLESGVYLFDLSNSLDPDDFDRLSQMI